MSQEIVDVLNEINEAFPNLNLTKEALLKPSAQFVTNFYTHVIKHFYEKFSILIKSDDYWQAPHDLDQYIPEIRLYFSLIKLLPMKTPIYISDILEPTSRRTKIFFKVYQHYLRYISEAIPTNNFDQIFQMFNDIENLENNKKHLIQLDNEMTLCIPKASEKEAQVLSERDKIQEELNILREKAAEVEHENTGKLNKIRQLSLEYQEIQDEIKIVEQEKVQVTAEIVDTTEYEHLQKIYENVKIEHDQVKTFNEEMNIGLKYQQETLQHLKDCLTALGSFPLELSNKQTINKYQSQLEANEEKYSLIEHNLKIVKQEESKVEMYDQLRAHLTEQQKYLDNEKNKFNQMLEELQNEYLNVTKLYKCKINTICEDETKIEKDILRIQTNYEQLKNTIKLQYRRVLQAEKSSATNLHSFFVFVINQKKFFDN